MFQHKTPINRLLNIQMLAGGKAVEAEATGNPLTFQTDLARPLKSLLIPFTPVQSGTGDPSPQNIRPIVAWDGVKVWNGGKNLFNKDTAVTGVWWKGSILSDAQYNNYKASDKIPVLPGGQYVLTRQSAQQGAVCYFDKNKQYVDQQTWDRYNPSRIVPDGVYYIAFSVEAEYIDSAQFEVGSIATAYEPYVPITDTDISFPSPVYGGTLDVVSGVLTVEYPTDEVSLDTLYFYMASDGAFVFMNLPFTFGDRTKIVCNSYKTVEFPYWSSMPDLSIMGSPSGDQIFRIRNNAFTDETTFRNHLTEIGAKIVYPLATPQEITLTPEQITALKGDNTIWSDADGSMTAVYLKKG